MAENDSAPSGDEVVEDLETDEEKGENDSFSGAGHSSAQISLCFCFSLVGSLGLVLCFLLIQHVALSEESSTKKSESIWSRANAASITNVPNEQPQGARTNEDGAEKGKNAPAQPIPQKMVEELQDEQPKGATTNEEDGAEKGKNAPAAAQPVSQKIAEDLQNEQPKGATTQMAEELRGRDSRERETSSSWPLALATSKPLAHKRKVSVKTVGDVDDELDVDAPFREWIEDKLSNVPAFKGVERKDMKYLCIITALTLMHNRGADGVDERVEEWNKNIRDPEWIKGPNGPEGKRAALAKRAPAFAEVYGLQESNAWALDLSDPEFLSSPDLQEKYKEYAEKAHIIELMPGNPPSLQWWFSRFGMADVIRKRVMSGEMLLIGASAGALVAGALLHTVSWSETSARAQLGAEGTFESPSIGITKEQYEAVGPWDGVVDLYGLNLFRGVTLFPHGMPKYVHQIESGMMTSGLPVISYADGHGIGFDPRDPNPTFLGNVDGRSWETPTRTEAVFPFWKWDASRTEQTERNMVPEDEQIAALAKVTEASGIPPMKPCLWERDFCSVPSGPAENVCWATEMSNEHAALTARSTNTERAAVVTPSSTSSAVPSSSTTSPLPDFLQRTPLALVASSSLVDLSKSDNEQTKDVSTQWLLEAVFARAQIPERFAGVSAATDLKSVHIWAGQDDDFAKNYVGKFAARFGLEHKNAHLINLPAEPLTPASVDIIQEAHIIELMPEQNLFALQWWLRRSRSEAPEFNLVSCIKERVGNRGALFIATGDSGILAGAMFNTARWRPRSELAPAHLEEAFINAIEQTDDYQLLGAWSDRPGQDSTGLDLFGGISFFSKKKPEHAKLLHSGILLSGMPVTGIADGHAIAFDPAKGHPILLSPPGITWNAPVDAETGEAPSQQELVEISKRPDSEVLRVRDGSSLCDETKLWIGELSCAHVALSEESFRKKSEAIWSKAKAASITITNVPNEQPKGATTNEDGAEERSSFLARVAPEVAERRADRFLERVGSKSSSVVVGGGGLQEDQSGREI